MNLCSVPFPEQTVRCHRNLCCPVNIEFVGQSESLNGSCHRPRALDFSQGCHSFHRPDHKKSSSSGKRNACSKTCSPRLPSLAVIKIFFVSSVKVLATCIHQEKPKHKRSCNLTITMNFFSLSLSALMGMLLVRAVSSSLFSLSCLHLFKAKHLSHNGDKTETDNENKHRPPALTTTPTCRPSPVTTTLPTPSLTRSSTSRSTTA